MKIFTFKAKDKEGNTVSGNVEAGNESSAARLLKERELVILSIKQRSKFSLESITSIGRKVGLGQVATFTSQLATMINSGLPLTDSLLILRAQSSKAFQLVINEVLSDVEEGESLSKALGKHPKVFDKTYIALVKSGEVGGVMEKVLLKLSENLEDKQEFQGKVKSALVYPIIIVVGMVIVAAVMMIFVIPKMLDLYTQFDAELPVSTKILMGVSDAVNKFWPLFIVFIGLFAYSVKSYISTENGRKNFDKFILKIPLIGPLQKQVILTDFTRTLSLMVGSGVSILESLSITSEVVGNKVIAEALVESSEMVEKGFPVAFAFSRYPDAFPFIVAQMVSVGEETGKMDEVLEKLSHVFETESDRKLKALTTMIEPIILLFLGVGVAFLVISVIMPIYNLTTQL